MAVGKWTFTDTARLKLIDGTFNIGPDSFKLALVLSNSNLSTSSTTWAGVTNEHANANGYTTGGKDVTFTTSGTTLVKVAFNDLTWTASGGSITARYACIYEAGGDVLGFFLLDDTPADVSATNGNTFTVSAPPTGLFTLSDAV